MEIIAVYRFLNKLNDKLKSEVEAKKHFELYTLFEIVPKEEINQPLNDIKKRVHVKLTRTLKFQSTV